MFGGKIAAVSAGAILILGLITYGFYKQNQNLKEATIELELQVENQTDTIIHLETSRSNIIVSLAELSTSINEIDTAVAKEKEYVRNTLNSHDLEKMVDKKASLVTRIVNKAVGKTMLAIEEVTDPNFISDRELKVDVESLKRL
jgi:hypothetical protein|tara:strand:+ start:363 stop:794 length:432 start_codon:yes stop_codon:yes gene_type:complete